MNRPDGYVMWGSAHSLYTGKLRSYLRKKGLAYVERFPCEPEFQSRVVPTVQQMVLPVLETPGGEMLQDTTEIIERLEADHPEPAMVPPGPVQSVIASLVDGYGSEALLPAAMHYRWTYRAQQERFLQAEFGRAVYAGPDRAAQLGAGAGLMAYFSGFLPTLGIMPETIPAFEAGYLEFLEAFDLHLQQWPYVLGGRPSIADFGLMAPLFAHLGRDPVPASLMKNVAPNVFRWTERMNGADTVDPGYPQVERAWLADDAIPATLEPVLQVIFRDWTPQLVADAAKYAEWLAEHPTMAPGTLVSHDGKHQVHPSVGAVEYPWRGCTVRKASAPHGLWHFDLAAARARALGPADRGRLESLLDRTGGRQAFGIVLPRPLKRERYRLVVG